MSQWGVFDSLNGAAVTFYWLFATCFFALILATTHDFFTFVIVSNIETARKRENYLLFSYNISLVVCSGV